MIERHREVSGISATPLRSGATENTLLTFKEAMEFLRVSRSTIYRLMWSGQLRGHKVGSSWRFYERDLLDAVSSPEMAVATIATAPTAPAHHTPGRPGEEA